MLRVVDSRFRETSLPNWRSEAEYFAYSKRKATFDELNCTLNADLRIERDEHVEVIWHHNESVEEVFAFCAIVIQHINEQACRTI